MKYRAKTYSEDGTIRYIFDVPVKTKHVLKAVSIEAAFIHLPDRKDGKPEYSLCLSSQIGCFYDCLMCANSGKPFYGCLTPAQINEQIRLVLGQDNNLEKIEAARQVELAVMAIGEPLLRFNVINAIKMHKSYVGDTRFALSTVGAKGTIERLTNADLPYPVRLELSLHFSNDRLRREWMMSLHPFREKDPELNIEQMLQEAEQFYEKYHGKITLNYMLIDGVNNMDENISELSNLLNGQRRKIFYVKVMWPNVTSSMVESRAEDYEFLINPRTTYSPRQFRKKLEEACIEATLFKSKGTRVYAGCGMMATRCFDETGVFTPHRIPQAERINIGFSS